MDRLAIPSPPSRRRPRPAEADRQRDAICAIAAAVFDVSEDALRKPTRGCAEVALARQMAMYLARVGLGLTLVEAGRLFGRDRTTAAHACRRVEDLRDKPQVDAVLASMESMMRARLMPTNGRSVR